MICGIDAEHITIETTWQRDGSLRYGSLREPDGAKQNAQRGQRLALRGRTTRSPSADPCWARVGAIQLEDRTTRRIITSSIGVGAAGGSAKSCDQFMSELPQAGNLRLVLR